MKDALPSVETMLAERTARRGQIFCTLDDISYDLPDSQAGRRIRRDIRELSGSPVSETTSGMIGRKIAQLDFAKSYDVESYDAYHVATYITNIIKQFSALENSEKYAAQIKTLTELQEEVDYPFPAISLGEEESEDGLLSLLH